MYGLKRDFEYHNEEVWQFFSWVLCVRKCVSFSWMGTWCNDSWIEPGPQIVNNKIKFQMLYFPLFTDYIIHCEFLFGSFFFDWIGCVNTRLPSGVSCILVLSWSSSGQKASSSVVAQPIETSLSMKAKPIESNSPMKAKPIEISWSMTATRLNPVKQARPRQLNPLRQAFPWQLSLFWQAHPWQLNSLRQAH